MPHIVYLQKSSYFPIILRSIINIPFSTINPIPFRHFSLKKMFLFPQWKSLPTYGKLNILNLLLPKLGRGPVCYFCLYLPCYDEIQLSCHRLGGLSCGLLVLGSALSIYVLDITYLTNAGTWYRLESFHFVILIVDFVFTVFALVSAAYVLMGLMQIWCWICICCAILYLVGILLTLQLSLLGYVLRIGCSCHRLQWHLKYLNFFLDI